VESKAIDLIKKVCVSNEIEPIDETSQKFLISKSNFEPSSNGTLDGDTYKPLGESTIPFRDMTTVASKKQQSMLSLKTKC
jgi:hypothetical protein